MSISGLAVVRPPLPAFWCRQSTIGWVVAPGRWGPTVTATSTAPAPTSAPEVSSDPRPRWLRLANQALVGLSRAAWRTSRKASSAPSQVPPAIPTSWPWAKAQERTKRLNDGRHASVVARIRNAAQSPRKAALAAPMAPATMKPAITVVGAALDR